LLSFKKIKQGNCLYFYRIHPCVFKKMPKMKACEWRNGDAQLGIVIPHWGFQEQVDANVSRQEVVLLAAD
jgi:hypothetical protein